MPTKIQMASPQNSELQLKGLRFDAAVLDNVDLWPRHDDVISGRERFSVLFEEVLAWTHGPILFTYTDATRLPEPALSII